MVGKLIKVENGYVLMVENIMYATDNDKLSLKNCQAIENGYDLDELADEYFMQEYAWCKSNTLPYTDEGVRITKKDFMSGAKTIIEILSDKKFSEEDMKKAMNKIVTSTYSNKGDDIFDLFVEINRKKYIDEYVQSLQQTEWDVEIVTEKFFKVEGNNGITIYAEAMEELDERNDYKLDKDGCLILKKK